MKKNLFIIFTILIFVGLGFALETRAANCDTDANSCSGADCSDCHSVNLSWTAFTQSDLNAIHPGYYTLASASYTVSGTVGSINTSETSASFSGLVENTSYNWQVTVNYYYVSGGGFSGFAVTSIYSFTTPICPRNNPPTATNLFRENCDWCVNPFQFRLNWTFSDPDGDSQYSKWLQVDDNPSFTSIDHDSGKIENNEIPAYTTFMSDGKGGVLQFNKTYYWRVKVYDSKGGESDWIEAPSSQTLISPLHAYPNPDFSYQPAKVREMQAVQFTDESYSPVGIARWSWTFQEGTPSASTMQNPTAIFETPGNKTIALTVWDVDNYSCSGGDGTQVIPVSIFAPTWREIIPW